MVTEQLLASVNEWVQEHQAEMVDDIIRLVNIRSVSEPGGGGYAMGRGCKDCADAFLAMGQKYGFGTENDDYYCASLIYPGRTEEELGILGHLDVVPEGEGWHYEPYQAGVKDGYIIGRGSGDNKGATVMSLYAMRCMKELNIELNHAIRLIAGFNEESGMKDVEHYLQGHKPPEYTIICDGGWAMCIGEKGILTANLVQDIHDGNLLDLSGGIVSNSVPASARAVFRELAPDVIEKLEEKYQDIRIEQKKNSVELTVKGVAAHAFRPHTGVNAIYKLLELICDNRLAAEDTLVKLQNLRACFTDNYGTGLGINYQDDISGETTCIGGMIRLQDGVLCQNINVRFAITQSSDDLIHNLNLRCSNLGIRLEDVDYSNPRYTSLDEPEVKLLLDTCHEVLSDEFEPYIMGGGTHARKFPKSLPYGPNIMSGFVNPFGEGHGIDEAVCIQHLTQTIPVYVAALIRLDEFYSQEK